jgi:hypothetical protein
MVMLQKNLAMTNIGITDIQTVDNCKRSRRERLMQQIEFITNLQQDEKKFQF